MRLAEQIKDYVKCPQTGSHHYGKWGLALTSAERMLVDRLCDQCIIFEDTADRFYKENAQLKEEIEKLQKEKELDNNFWKQECDSLQKTLAKKDEEIKNGYKETVDIICDRIYIWLQQEGFYTEEFEDLFDYVRGK